MERSSSRNKLTDLEIIIGHDVRETIKWLRDNEILK